MGGIAIFTLEVRPGSLWLCLMLWHPGKGNDAVKIVILSVDTAYRHVCGLSHDAIANLVAHPYPRPKEVPERRGRISALEG